MKYLGIEGVSQILFYIILLYKLFFIHFYYKICDKPFHFYRIPTLIFALIFNDLSCHRMIQMLYEHNLEKHNVILNV